MQGLYDLTQKLAALFGGACSSSRRCSAAPRASSSASATTTCSAPASTTTSSSARSSASSIRARNKARQGKAGPRDRLWINVNADEEFDRIRTVERVRGNAEAHRKHRRTRSRATRPGCAQFLDDLGLRWEPQRAARSRAARSIARACARSSPAAIRGS